MWLDTFVDTPIATQDDHFDLIIIGSGSGNAIPSYLDDYRIAMIEEGTFGGTCLNVGCIPSKMFVLPADRAVEAQHNAPLGVRTSFDSSDFAAIRDRVFGRIDPISHGGRDYRRSGSNNVTLFEGRGRFIGERTIDVAGHVLRAEQILVATGSRPHIPDIAGLDDVGAQTSNTIMRLDALPDRLGIIGGGFIAVEMGHVFSGLGSHVTVFNRGTRLLRTADTDISDRFTEVFAERADLVLGATPSSVRRDGDEIVVASNGVEYRVDELLVATGRTPNSDTVDAAAGGLVVQPTGVIEVDRYMRTSVPGVWAVGDVANSWQLKHVANNEAAAAFWNIAHPDDLRAADHTAVPAAVFSHPQVGSVGMTERDARAAGHDVVVGRRDYAGTAYGWALADETSFAKVVVERQTERILGAHIIGPQAATLVQPLIQAMHFGQTAREVATGPYWIHPALTEVVENALLDAIGQLADER